MSNEESRNSLADQAAAWVPPWQRPTPPRQTGDDSPRQEDLGTETPPEGPEVSKIQQDADAAAEAEPAPTAGEGAAGRVPKKHPAARRRVVPEPAPELDDAELRGALEAILLVVDEPVAEATLAEVLEQPPARVGAMLDQIAAGYTASGYGFELRRAAGGWRLYTRPEYAGYVERFVLEGQSVRLTQAALETLAVVAYKQPVTRSRISAIRGVNCDGVIRTLVTRGLVEECGSEPESGAFLYRTTTLFLEKLGLNTVDELPPLAPFLPDDVEELSDATR
ncbi:SMC-Scp complex subunit ScpB [Micromonospora musae]|uniref:SMC-Scp complex subunit ScpB n=1 Tax=Micromonospora musae TaxID=1894970 RepID=UPI00343DBFB3